MARTFQNIGVRNINLTADWYSCNRSGRISARSIATKNCFIENYVDKLLELLGSDCNWLPCMELIMR